MIRFSTPISEFGRVPRQSVNHLIVSLKVYDTDTFFRSKKKERKRYFSLFLFLSFVSDFFLITNSPNALHLYYNTNTSKICFFYLFNIQICFWLLCHLIHFLSVNIKRRCDGQQYYRFTDFSKKLTQLIITQCFISVMREVIKNLKQESFPLKILGVFFIKPYVFCLFWRGKIYYFQYHYPYR